MYITEKIDEYLKEGKKVEQWQDFFRAIKNTIKRAMPLRYLIKCMDCGNKFKLPLSKQAMYVGPIECPKCGSIDTVPTMDKKISIKYDKDAADKADKYRKKWGI